METINIVTLALILLTISNIFWFSKYIKKSNEYKRYNSYTVFYKIETKTGKIVSEGYFSEVQLERKNGKNITDNIMTFAEDKLIEEGYMKDRVNYQVYITNIVNNYE